MKLELYYAPIACPLVPYVLLHEAGADFDVQVISLRTGQQKSAEFLRLNPKHKVPLLLVDGAPLSENLAIQTWIARNFPEARLLPQSPWDELQALSLLSWCASGFHPHLSRINAPEKFCAAEGSSDSVVAIAKANLEEQFQVAEDLLAGREFFFDHFTAPDAYFFWCYRRAGQLGVDLSGFPACQQHFERMGQRDSVRKVLEAESQALRE